MSRVSHFQRFSQPENHATNNTLLLLRYFYQSSPFKIQSVLTSLLETDLSIGLAFEQQIRGDASIPDALITQEQMRIFVETKRGGALDPEQIRRHLKSIAQHAATGRGDGSILIGLTKEPIAESERKVLVAEAASQGITFAAVTFTQIVEALRTQCADYERELLSIVEDYENYLAEEGLLEERNQWLVVFPCGTSITENARFSLYYEPPSRPCKRNYRFIGVYNRKTVAYVGTVEAIAVTSCQDGVVSFAEEAGQLTDSHCQRIKSAIEETRYYDLKANPHRFYLVDSFVATDAKKTSPGGIWGLRYLDLSKIVPSYPSDQPRSGASGFPFGRGELREFR
ncbi:MAG: hypothetical protein LAO55_27675 [Acidobacteriia bacterium]|nr:hypothetical protein [Terriglobia bacterium]